MTHWTTSLKTAPLRTTSPWALISIMLLPMLSLSSPVAAGELAGAQMQDTIHVNEEALLLNGMGLRKKAIFKVYVGGLYLTKQQSDAGAILADDSPRRMVMHFLRSVGADSISDAWKDCLAAQSGTPTADLSRQFDQLASWMGDVEDGDRLEFTYQPGQGTTVAVQGKTQGTVDGKAFADTLLSCWIGSSPPSADFKAGLLGR